ncbi:MAG: hypothetical protein M1818_002055 [Claussenomyces sp. TS43310]|nr:MAG: hypothetical protein M1818_002055 [Claussenomyces sp. TS43310]
MAPLILHNVPEDELYVGDDGIQRPYAMLFPGSEGHASAVRARKAVPETGSFGKSTRRSRSRSTQPPAKKEDPTLQAADAVFGKYFAEQAAAQVQPPQRKQSLSNSISQPNLASQASTTLTTSDASTAPTDRYVHKVPTEVILRGFKSTHQYAAIRTYECIAGRICEDYPRDAPVDQRRYKSDLRDPTSLRTRPLTLEEKAKAMRFAGDENWIKVTFESAEAAESAAYASPQIVLGHLVYAEPYRGMPPTNQDALPAVGPSKTGFHLQTLGPSSPTFSGAERRPSSTLPRSFTTPSMTQIGRGHDGQTQQFSPPDSLSSSTTLDTATLSTATIASSSATLTNSPAREAVPLVSSQSENGSIERQRLYCRTIPTAKRAQLLPASQALLPQKTYAQQITSNLPLVAWFSKDVIGTEVPRTESGDFDWANSSFYWRIVWWLDSMFGLFGGDLAGEKDE